jgi:hypothetical protein
MGNLPAEQVTALLEKMQKSAAGRGRLIFIMDATASRQPSWDSAAKLQAELFTTATRSGTLAVQLVYYRGLSECRASAWTTNARELGQMMSRIICVSGATQIAKSLAYVRKEHSQQPVSAVVFVGDAMEEEPATLYNAVAGLPPLFVFQEGDNECAAEVFQRLARESYGAYHRFDAGAAGQLAELLRAVATYAVGGTQALADLRTDAARKLLGQVKGRSPNEN